MAKKKWIKSAIRDKGSLRRTLGAKEGEPIPQEKLEKAASKSGKTGKRARLALTLKKMRRKK